MILRAAALLALLTVGCRDQPQTGERAGSGRSNPQLALLTSLPLAFPETLSLDAPAHPAMKRLEADFEITLLDGPEQAPERGLMLAAQPQALTAERLVALDSWVRRGGRIVLLADPQLSWDSQRPLGDRLRPPFAFPDTGLLAHWGLRLEAPEQGGPATRQLGGMQVLTASPGRLHGEKGGACQVSEDGLVARCSIGEGRAVVVADADFIQAGTAGGLDGPIEHNIAALVAELNGLAR